MLKLYKMCKIHSMKYNCYYNLLLVTIIDYIYIITIVKYTIIENLIKRLYTLLLIDIKLFFKYFNVNFLLRRNLLFK